MRIYLAGVLLAVLTNHYFASRPVMSVFMSNRSAQAGIIKFIKIINNKVINLEINY